MNDHATAASDIDVLFQPIRVGELSLPNRVVMAPLTRNRAGDGNVPTPSTPPIMSSGPAPD